MPNHVHLLIETPETNLGNGMQWLHGRYARGFNERYARKGHLFETRYLSPMVLTDEALVRTVGYIIVNPVAAVLSTSAEDWEWGSHAFVAAGDAPEWLAHVRLEGFLEDIGGSRCYATLVETHQRGLRNDRSAASSTGRLIVGNFAVAGADYLSASVSP